VVVVWRSEW